MAKKVKKTPKQLAAAKRNLAKAHAKPKSKAQIEAAKKNMKVAQKESLRLRTKSRAQATAILKRTKDVNKIIKYAKTISNKKKTSKK